MNKILFLYISINNIFRNICKKMYYSLRRDPLEKYHNAIFAEKCECINKGIFIKTKINKCFAFQFLCKFYHLHNIGIFFLFLIERNIFNIGYVTVFCTSK